MIWGGGKLAVYAAILNLFCTHTISSEVNYGTKTLGGICASPVLNAWILLEARVSERMTGNFTHKYVLPRTHASDHCENCDIAITRFQKIHCKLNRHGTTQSRTTQHSLLRSCKIFTLRLPRPRSIQSPQFDEQVLPNYHTYILRDY